LPLFVIRVFETTGVGTQPNITRGDSLVKAEIGLSQGSWQRQRSTLEPIHNKRGWRQQVDVDASHPSFVAGRCADAIENRLFAPPGRGLRGARFRNLSPQPKRTIGEIVPDIL
jgi:hypothetical protein